MTILMIGLLVAASFAGVFFSHNRLQTASDEIALTGARKLNEFNRLGQMNELIARSRQLVYITNQENDNVKGGKDPLLEKFAQQLNNEVLDSAASLDKERHALSALAQAEAKQEMKAKFDQLKDSYSMRLPWLTVETPNLISMSTGKIDGLDSNATALAGITDLSDQDQKSNYVIKGKQISLYRADTDASLPIPNSPHFRFSPLPAPVAKNLAPARTALPEAFKSIIGDYAPCAIQLQLSLKVGSGLGPQGQGEFKVASTAVATGGAIF